MCILMLFQKFDLMYQSFLYYCFGEGLRLATDALDCKNYYMYNPSFDIMEKESLKNLLYKKEPISRLLNLTSRNNMSL